MNPERFARLKSILLEASRLTDPDRSAYLDDACADDPDLRREVESLLAHERDPPAIVATAGAMEVFEELQSGTASSPSQTPAPPERIGPYIILETLGEGGMGVVYRAEQIEPIRREIAIKLIRAGLRKGAVQRFESERQALARMDHPNIARVLDAGTSEDGQPYFVMELVHGEPITEYCDARRLGITERLNLFLRVGQGIQHAHQRGVIHRDIKPSNILVTAQDGEPLPKVIDFGIAKAVEDPLTGRSMATEAGQLVGTPEYMSPEQATTVGAFLDTRTDVYSLGILLFELLAGMHPFDRDRLRAAGITEVLRILREEDPPRPSQRFERLPPELQRIIAERRVTEPRALVRRLRDDLDWIVLRALEKEPIRRYPSVSEMSADLIRCLNDEPVMAGPPSTAYRVRKFVRRHRASVTAAALVGVALVVGVVGTTWQAVTATRERQRAERHLEDLSQFASSVVFGVHDRVRDLPESTPVREYIVQTTLDYLDRVARDPAAEDHLRLPLSAAYAQLSAAQTDLGRPEEALQSALTSVDLAEGAVPKASDHDAATWALATRLDGTADILASLGRSEDALAYHLRVIDLMEDLVVHHPDSTDMADHLARSKARAGFILIRVGRAGDALPLYESALAIQTDLVARDPESERARSSLALVHAFYAEGLSEVSRDEDSLDHYLQSAELLEALRAANPGNNRLRSNLATVLGAVAVGYVDLDRAEEALPVQRRSVELRQQWVDEQPDNMSAHHDLARGYEQLGRVQIEAGRPQEARVSFELGRMILEEIVAAEEANADAIRDLVTTLHGLAEVDQREGRYRASMTLVARGDVLNEGMVEREPNRTDHHWHRAWGYHLMGQAHAGLAAAEAETGARRQRWETAREWSARSVSTVAFMREEGLMSPYLENALSDCEVGLARCDSALAALAGGEAPATGGD